MIARVTTLLERTARSNTRPHVSQGSVCQLVSQRRPLSGRYWRPGHGDVDHQQLQQQQQLQNGGSWVCLAAAEDSSPNLEAYPLSKTKILVETSMLAAVSGLTYVVSTILKLEGSLGYFLPLPIILSAMRSGAFAGWRTMYTTGFLLVVLLGPLRAISYVFIHGLLAATLGTLWKMRTNWWLSVVVGALVRMLGQCAYLVLSSVTMNENLFLLMLSNVYSMLDQIAASIGSSGAPSTLAVICMIFSLLLVNGLCYSFLLHVIYRILLNYMGYEMGPLPGIVKKYLFAGQVTQADLEAQQKAKGL